MPVLESDTSKQVELQPESEDADTVKHKEIAAAARVLNVFRDIQVSMFWIVHSYQGHIACKGCLMF